jgi:hypothetical protein
MSDTRTKPGSNYGIVVLVVGVGLRLAAQKLAWPSNFSFSGARSETQWARMEDAYADVAVVLMCIGGVLIALRYARQLFGNDMREQPPAEQDK